jgi:hypothetical protein
MLCTSLCDGPFIPTLDELRVNTKAVLSIGIEVCYFIADGDGTETDRSEKGNAHV